MRSIKKYRYFAAAIKALVILSLIWMAGLFSAATPTPTAPLSAPTNLTTEVMAGGQVKLHWTDNSYDEAVFRIERATDSQFINFRVMFTVPPNTESFIDNTVAVLSTYYYRVSAFNEKGSSPVTNTAQATTPAKLAFPKAPSELIGRAQPAAIISLNWKDQSDNEKGFRVEQADDDLFTLGLQTFAVNAGITSFSNTGLKSAKTYYYRVVAWNEMGDSPPSNVVNVNVLDALPEPPSEFVAQAIGNKQVRFRWTDTSNNETGFQIERASDSAFSRDFTVYTTEAHLGSFTPMSVTDRQSPSGTFYFRVKSFNDSGNSPNSNVSQVNVTNQLDGDTPLFGNDTASLSFPGFYQSMGSLTIDRMGQFPGGSLLLDMSDNLGSLEIPASTVMMNANGHPLTVISYSKPDVFPQPPEKTIIVRSFDFGLNGSTFSNKIKLTLKYDPANFPQYTTYADLKLLSWNGSNWQGLTDFKLIPDQKMITATMTHTGLVAIICPKPDLSAKFAVSNLQIYPQAAYVGNTINVSITVTNTGLKYGYGDVVLKVNGVKEDSKQVSLDAGARTDVSFTLANKPVNDYSLDVNGTWGAFSVRPAPPASPSPASTSAPTTTSPISTTYSPVVPTELPAKSIQMPVLIIIVAAVVLFLAALIFFLIKR